MGCLTKLLTSHPQSLLEQGERGGIQTSLGGFLPLPERAAALECCGIIEIDGTF